MKSRDIKQNDNKNALIFGLTSVVLYGIGFGLIAPVVPFLVQPYVHGSGNQAMAVAMLTLVYAACVFLAAPILGALSDRYGRRPVLMICLMGSAIGYLIFGIGGALWVLFLGRIIDGLTGGNISTILAYFADITPEDKRIKYFGWAGAAAGIGSIIGPTIGGLLARFGYSIPIYFGVLITLLNALYGIVYMPESLSKEHRIHTISFTRLNPFTQLSSVFSMKSLKWIFIAIFLLGIPSGALQAIFSQFAKDSFMWNPSMIGILFSILGAMDIISQSIIMPKLIIKLKPSQIALIGMISEIIAYVFFAASGIFKYSPFFIVATIIFGFGDAIFGPSVNGVASSNVSLENQGRLQGTSQSVQALTRIIGPLLGGELYIYLGHFSPALMGVILVAAAIVAMKKA